MRHKCRSCENFDLCDRCFKGARPASHDAAHSFRPMSPKSAVYYASGGSRISLEPDDEDYNTDSKHLMLQARGWFVDTVTELGPWIKMRSPGPGRISLRLDLSGLPGDTTGLSDGFQRAITGNRRILTVRGANDHGTEEQISCVPRTWLQAVRDIHLAKDSMELSGLQNQIMTSISLMASGSRRYAVTGKSIGFVPASTEPGDAVCILAGCTVPVVLRKTTWLNNDDWVLVGECYVEGLMEGEFMKAMMDSGTLVEPSHISIG